VFCEDRIIAVELSEELRDRRKAAGRTIASVAVDAGLSVPYIANLENGRGNPTLAAVDRLATALGARLELTLIDEHPPAASSPEAAFDALLAASPRAAEVIAKLASAQGKTRTAVRRRLATALAALGALLPSPPTDADLNRLLDLLLLAD
jgi:transcriptional regulator with XRE-family HTH domain